jgi:mono/diheme cytochrome c family protein
MRAHRLIWAGKLACAFLAGGIALASAQDRAAVERGSAKFQHSCAPCHGAGRGDDGRTMLPGTEALSIKYNGEIPAVLEHRPGLTAAVIKAFVRQGSWSMPPFRPTELSDAEINDIAEYLDESSRLAASSARQ